MGVSKVTSPYLPDVVESEPVSNGSVPAESVEEPVEVQSTPARKVGATTISSVSGAAFGTYLAILIVQVFGFDRVLDSDGVQALSGVLAIVCGVVGGYLAPPTVRVDK